MIDSHRSPTIPTRLRLPRRDTGPLPPACDCGTPMQRGELPIPPIPVPHFAGRIGAPARRPLALPVWRCPACGRQQPRIDT